MRCILVWREREGAIKLFGAHFHVASNDYSRFLHNMTSYDYQYSALNKSFLASPFWFSHDLRCRNVFIIQPRSQHLLPFFIFGSLVVWKNCLGAYLVPAAVRLCFLLLYFAHAAQLPWSSCGHWPQCSPLCSWALNVATMGFASYVVLQESFLPAQFKFSHDAPTFLFIWAPSQHLLVFIFLSALWFGRNV